MANDLDTGPNRPPAEGRPDLGIPGADRDDVPVGGVPEQEFPGREDELPEQLSDRIHGRDRGVATGGSDVKPDVEIPDESM